MRIKVGLSNTDLTSLNHGLATISCSADCQIFPFRVSETGTPLHRLTRGQKLRIQIKENTIRFSIFQNGNKLKSFDSESVIIKPSTAAARLTLESVRREGAKGRHAPSYQGDLIVRAQSGKVRLTLELDLESYLNGVLDSEIPASYHLEAIKAQALAARTYALNPRISHVSDQANVCDSYLCCQYFAGHKVLSGRHKQALNETRGEIITYNGKPILALFSSNAGGHTENFENCFSDPITNQFPPPPLPYLRGVPEGKLPAGFNQDPGRGIVELWKEKAPVTVDAWSPHFKWEVVLSAQAIEAHMHHTIETLRKTKDMAPFIVAPPSGTFGHVERFEVTRRGVSGTAIELMIHTSHGRWEIRKELVIRSVFKNPEARLTRLKSARFFLLHENDSLNLLKRVVIRGLGWGHGVGLQQTGAQGLALRGKSHREIINHYFTNIEIAKV